MKVMVVFGTRPEAIKLAPVILELKKHPKIVTRVCVTAQHREMLDQALDVFKIRPDYDLNLMKQNQSLFDITTNVLRALERVLIKENPDMVLIQGDTTTAFAAGLSAYYLKIKIGHIEAGLRSYDKYNPFPEEINRKLLDDISDYLFAPTELSRKNLIREGISENKIFVTGNTAIDALLWVVKKISRPKLYNRLYEDFEERYGVSLDNNPIIVVTCHRRESFGKEFENICKGIKKIAEQNKNIHIIYPVHPNPNIKDLAYSKLGKIRNIHLIEPLDYVHFVFLMSHAYLILTDSGGIQEEAPSLGKPVLVLRNKTERVEAVESGVAKIVGTKPESIFKETQKLLYVKEEYDKMIKKKNPYGDGKAAKRIVSIILKAQL